MKITKFYRSAKNGIRTGQYVRAVERGRLRQDTILLESKNAKDLAGNLFRILQELHREEYKDFQIYLAIRKENKAKVKALTDAYGLKRFSFVRYASRNYYRLLATAKFLVEDTSFPDKFIKRPDQVYLNTWHGTPLKLMGRDEVAGAYAIGNVQKNFLYADYLLFPNNFMKSVMMKAYMLEDLYRGKVLLSGYPRNAIFFDQDNYQFMRRTLGVEDKQVIVYMPTWRGEVNHSDTEQTEQDSLRMFDELDELLQDNQIFYVKFHLFAAMSFPFSRYKHILPFPSGYETYEILNAADCLVTDYSSVFFDFANSGRKIILFPYDFEEYRGVRGLYLDLEDLPFPKVYHCKALAEELGKPKEYDESAFLKQFCTYDSKDATRELVQRVFRDQKFTERMDIKKETISLSKKDIFSHGYEINYKKIQDADPRKKILLYSAGMDQNGLSTALLNLLKEADTTKNQYYFTFFQNSMRRTPLRIERIPNDVNYLPLNGTITDLTFLELVAFKLFYRFGVDKAFVLHYVKRLYAREFRKHYANIPFDGVIHFTGYSKEVTMMFLTAPCKRAIFVHSDMLREIKTRKNQHLLTLKHAYHEYDMVIPVSESVRRSILPIADEKKLLVIDNTHDDKGVKEKAEKELVIDSDTLLNVEEEKLKQVLDDTSIQKFINVGRFSPEKGHKKLMEAFDRFHREHKDTALILLGGNGGLYDETVEFAASLSCGDSIYLIRSLSNPFPVVKKCQLFLLASDYEALGLVLLEAESLSLPVVSTDIEGPRELLLRYGGKTVPNSVEGLYQGMCLYWQGKIKPMGISFEDYNRESVEKFDQLFFS